MTHSAINDFKVMAELQENKNGMLRAYLIKQTSQNPTHKLHNTTNEHNLV